MASPKDLKPKIHEGIGLKAHETKGRKKKVQLAKQITKCVVAQTNHQLTKVCRGK